MVDDNLFLCFFNRNLVMKSFKVKTYICFITSYNLDQPPLIPPSVSYVARTPDSGGHGPFNLLQWPYRMIFLLLSDMKHSYGMEYKIKNLTIIVLSSLFLPPKILFFYQSNQKESVYLTGPFLR